MLVGYINCLEDEKSLLNPVLYQGLETLKKTDFFRVEPGKYIVGDGIFYTVNEFNTESREKRKAERHSKFVDIQYLVSGEEIIGFAKASDSATVLDDFLDEKDIMFYGIVPGESDIKMSAGYYAIFFPWDIHRPGCVVDHPVKVRKVILKIEKNLLRL